MVNRITIYSILLDATAVPLAVLGFLYAASGICLAGPSAVPLPYQLCARLHLDSLFLPTAVLAAVHGGAGLAIWLSKIGRGLDLLAWPPTAAAVALLLLWRWPA